MNDLISRNRAISILEQLEEHSLSGKMDISNAIYLLKNQPTAYDLDNVVEELEIERKTANNTYNSFNMSVDLGRVFGLEKAIEIVKQGGKERI